MRPTLMAGSSIDESLSYTQFLLVRTKNRPGLEGTRYAVQVLAIEDAERPHRSTNAERYEYAYCNAAVRRSGRVASCGFILLLSKTAEWWAMLALERQTYCDPHGDRDTGAAIPGHARTVERGLQMLHRRLHYNLQGRGREREFDCVMCFEREVSYAGTFADILRVLRDSGSTPEWRFARKRPLWRSRRVLGW